MSPSLSVLDGVILVSLLPLAVLSYMLKSIQVSCAVLGAKPWKPPQTTWVLLHNAANHLVPHYAFSLFVKSKGIIIIFSGLYHRDTNITMLETSI